MAKLVWALALASTSALAGCGSHSHAPVVYGTAPNAQPARVYNAPGQYQPAQTAYSSHPTTWSPAPSAQPTYRTGISPAVATSGLAPLTPVSETYREGRMNYETQPVYLAQAEAPIVNDPIQTLPGQVTVLPGDTVYAISRRTGASPQSIIALNSLQAPYTLTVGQTIRVPSSAVPPSHAAAQQMTAPSLHAVSTAREGAHIVKQGDTLYSISRATGAGVADIARANNLRAPYSISVGQTLRIPGATLTPAQQTASAPAAGDVADIARTVSYEAPPPKKSTMFDWPVQGAIIGSYGLSTAGKRNDGVNIAAPIGTPVRAAADGEVVYRGSELDGYGNLILIKHEDGFVTAYAHNDAMLVKKGDRVRQGQVIAKVGKTGSASEPQLHFEIRQNLKAVDPVALLGSL